MSEDDKNVLEEFTEGLADIRNDATRVVSDVASEGVKIASQVTERSVKGAGLALKEASDAMPENTVLLSLLKAKYLLVAGGGIAVGGAILGPDGVTKFSKEAGKLAGQAKSLFGGTQKPTEPPSAEGEPEKPEEKQTQTSKPPSRDKM